MRRTKEEEEEERERERERDLYFDLILWMGP